MPYDSGMTKRITVSLPDDVAEYLAREENASAAVADAVRARMNRGAAALAVLRAAGFDITDEGLARARGKLPRLAPEQRAESRRRAQLIEAGAWPAGATADNTAT
jgi:BMFP domain-containing protein YqiC